jgi:hypothetical protein
MDSTALQELIAQVRGTVAELAATEQRVASFTVELARGAEQGPNPLSRIGRRLQNVAAQDGWPPAERPRPGFTSDMAYSRPSLRGIFAARRLERRSDRHGLHLPCRIGAVSRLREVRRTRASGDTGSYRSPACSRCGDREFGFSEVAPATSGKISYHFGMEASFLRDSPSGDSWPGSA